MSKPDLYGILVIIGLFILFYLIVKVKGQRTSNPLHIIDLCVINVMNLLSPLASEWLLKRSNNAI